MMEVLAYTGKILFVDLNTGRIKKQEYDLELGTKFLGGFGMNTKFALDMIRPRIDPLSPDNVMIFGSGPFVGTRIPAANRISVTTKFPLTGTIGTSTGAGNFAVGLKESGYDHLIITGKAPYPVYLKILGEEVEICDARFLWGGKGKDLYQTTDFLHGIYGENSGVVAIGAAGENMIPVALTFVDKTSAMGKGGLGAVMGSKNLKAIVAKGDKKVNVSDAERVDRIGHELRKNMANAAKNTDKNLGSMSVWNQVMENGFPYKNWSEIYPEDKASSLYGPEVFASKGLKKRSISCSSCPAVSKELLGIDEGEYAGLETYVSGFFGRVYLWGARCDVGNIERVVKCHDWANRVGICEYSTTAMIDFAVELFRMGIITDKDTGGLRLERGFTTTQKLMDQIIKAEGIGETLGKGIKGIIQRFGKEAEDQAVHIKGSDFPYDPRVDRLTPYNFTQITNPRAGHQYPGWTPMYLNRQLPLSVLEEYCKNIGLSPDAMNRVFESPVGFNVGRLTRHTEDWWSILTSLGQCARVKIIRNFNIENISELYSAVTGVETSPEEIKKAGERCWNLHKVINVREGFSRKDDRFPRKWFEPIKTTQGNLFAFEFYGDRPLTEKDFEGYLENYYEERGWDIQHGIPTKEKLQNLGLIGILD